MAATLLTCLLGLWTLDRLFPLSALLEAQGVSRTVLDRSGMPLRAFPNQAGLWRWSVPLDDIDEKYIDTLLAYEDQYFWHHPGVNPLSLIRALGQGIANGRMISGGSTLTMQVARLLDWHEKSLTGKLKQMARALQLEAHYSKREILQLYVELAPFGGILQGVGSASHAYFGKSAEHLSLAEAALLTVIPQQPARLRLDRFPAKAQKARDKVLTRLLRKGLISEAEWQRARQERVALAPAIRLPRQAPLASRLMSRTLPQQKMIHSTLDSRLQADLALVLQGQTVPLPPGVSLAALIVHNRTGEVLAYQGSADFTNDSRYGHVDMVRATRSPGSTLKPFMYGLALERELVHSHSLLLDVPMTYAGYRPENYHRGYQGPVSLSRALQLSLNTTAVQVLYLLGPDTFYARMRSAGVPLQLPVANAANLSMVLGGTGISLWHLVEAYTALAPVNKGHARPLTLLKDHARPQQGTPLLASGASEVIHDILSSAPRPRTRLVRHHGVAGLSNAMAWKTGTSFGGRDAWSVGVLPEHTLGVWVGRPDGGAQNELTGAATALPVLFQLEALMHQHQGPVRREGREPGASHPHQGEHQEIEKADICWPLGKRKDQTAAAACHQTLEARLIKGVAPPTARFSQAQLNAVGGSFWQTAEGTRVPPACRLRGRWQPNPERQSYALWPSILMPWLPAYRHSSRLIPPVDAVCHRDADPLWQYQDNRIHFTGIRQDNTYKPLPGKRTVPFSVQALGTVGQRWWFVNDRLLQVTGEKQPLLHEVDRPGAYRLTVIDSQGQTSQVDFQIIL